MSSYTTTFLNWCRSRPEGFCRDFVADRQRPVKRTPRRYESEVYEWARRRGLVDAFDAVWLAYRSECRRGGE